MSKSKPETITIELPFPHPKMEVWRVLNKRVERNAEVE